MTQTQKHTPGPWAIREIRRLLRSDEDCDSGLQPISDPEVEANARLIAAAPELLAALKRMVETYRKGVQDDREPMMVRQAIAAIAKAEGR